MNEKGEMVDERSFSQKPINANSGALLMGSEKLRSLGEIYLAVPSNNCDFKGCIGCKFISYPSRSSDNQTFSFEVGKTLLRLVLKSLISALNVLFLCILR